MSIIVPPFESKTRLPDFQKALFSRYYVIVVSKIFSLDSWKFTNWQYIENKIGNEILRKRIWCQNPTQTTLGLHLQNKCWKLVRLYVICCDYNSPVTKIHMKEKNTAWTNTFLETIIIEKFRVLTLSRKRGNISDRRLSIKEMPVLNLHTFFYIRVTCHVISTYISCSLVVFVIECLWTLKSLKNDCKTTLIFVSEAYLLVHTHCNLAILGFRWRYCFLVSTVFLRFDKKMRKI